jgi:hypothetical protein
MRTDVSEKRITSIFGVENQPSKRTRVQQVARQNSVYSTCCMLVFGRLFFDPEDGGNTFLRNIGSQTDCMALYPKRWQR